MKMRRVFAVLLAIAICLTMSATAFAADEKPMFDDVKPGDWFYDSVYWALEERVTVGTSAHTFSPDRECNLAELATFVWRAADRRPASPLYRELPTTGDPEMDEAIGRTAMFDCMTKEEAVDAQFRKCTRGRTIVFLYTYYEKFVDDYAMPELWWETEHPFTDLPEDDELLQEAVLWGYYYGFTNGTSATTFSPDSVLTRAQVCTFIMRIHQHLAIEV